VTVLQAPASAPLFSCEGIDLTLGGRQILHDVGVDAHAGHILGVVGPNGAGKTSLFEVLSGRVSQQRGTVRLDGTDISRFSIQQRVRAGIGRTYQSPVVPNGLPVADVLEAARKAFYPRLTSQRAEWAADIVHLNVPGHILAGSLDTLQRRKLLLACLVMRRPKVLLLDEPASGLISAELEELDQVLRVLAHEMRIALLVVEHRLELLAAVADEVVVLDLGRRIANGAPEKVFDHPDVRAAYFETVEA
jgi:ABC-type branched-subunit amino acid transport system ATPase component